MYYKDIVTICHISSVHAAGDPRVRLKQVQSTAKKYTKVFYVTGDLSASPLACEPMGLKIIKVFPGKKNRLLRFFVTTPFSILKGMQTKADIFHIHDPELILWAWLLRLSGRSVVYDIHEDYVTSITQKSYIPLIFRSFLAKVFDWFETTATNSFYKVIAESYYENRFPTATPVLNYPIVKDLLPVEAFSINSEELIYTGNVTPDRGALLMSEFHAASAKYSVQFVGRCSPERYREMIDFSTTVGKEPPMVEGVGQFVEFSQIIDFYAQGKWLAGIAIFPDTEHYRKKELTKFFEYMAVGLPIIASDFPVWKKLIEEQGVGICVPPGDNSAIEEALDWLRENPEKALAMSRKGKDLAKNKYSWESQAEKLMRLYEHIVRRKENSSLT